MKVNLLFIDKIILFLLSFVVLVDMFNGLFAMEFTKLPISQAYKFIVLILILFRLTSGREIGFIILFFSVLQIGPINGLIKTGDTEVFINDIIVSTKWLIVPISFFYFKQLFQNTNFLFVRQHLLLVVKRAFGFISLNMILGFLGFGMAFYYHGFSNAIGTKGFIYAGNELTIMVLAIGFIIAVYLYQKEDYKNFALTFICFLVFSFLITSKTVLGGVVIVYLVPIISSIRLRIRKKWLDYITAFFFLGIPFLILALYLGITNSGVIDKFQLSLKRNEYDLLTVILSNRNNFVNQGWDIFTNEFSWGGKIFGYGQGYHLQLSGHSAEVDFLSLLFASGILGVLFLILILSYWIINANNLKTIYGYIYARPALIFLWFIIITSNLSGHVFGSGIAGFFIGLSIAMMFYNSHRTGNEPV